MAMNELLYNAVDAGVILCASPQTVGRWIRSGDLRAVKIGRRWKIRESDLEAFVEKMDHNTGGGEQAPTSTPVPRPPAHRTYGGATDD